MRGPVLGDVRCLDLFVRATWLRGGAVRRLVMPYLSGYEQLMRRPADGSRLSSSREGSGSTPRLPEASSGTFSPLLPSDHSGAHGHARRSLPCTSEQCRRWEEAAVAYATALNDIHAELEAVKQRAARARWWRPFQWRRTAAAWEEIQQRYPLEIQAVSEAYEPVRQEIEPALQAERKRLVQQARDEESRRSERRIRRARLAEREIWGWTSTGGDEDQEVYVFRHDVMSASVPDSASLSLPDLRRALTRHGLSHAVWDTDSLAATERELEGFTFAQWWMGEFNDEDYRTGLTSQRGHGKSPPWRHSGFTVHGV